MHLKGKRGISWSLCFLALTFLLGSAACGPPWWRKGRPRKRHRSFAEVELLSRLAELLMPRLPIGELFRDFTVKPSPAWDSRSLSPGIAVFGVLQNDGAALFVDYDGSHQGSDGPGCNSTKQHKTKALLRYAPEGSCVLRIGHATGNCRRQEHSADAIVNTWRDGHEPSLMKAVSQSVWALLSSCDIALREDVSQRLHTFQVTEPKPRFNEARKFASKAVLVGDVENKEAQVFAFLREHLRFSEAQIQALVDKFPKILRISIDDKLKPTVSCFEDLGLSGQQVTKVLLGHPQVLRFNIEANLKPTVAWFQSVGLSREQVAKVVASSPFVLGCSIEEKLKPTVKWLEDAGLCRKQVCKAVAGFPGLLGLSVKSNLKPKVAWLRDLGLSRQQLTKVVANFPQLLGLSIGAKLKATEAWLWGVGLSREQVAKVVACSPSVLGYSLEANLKPKVAWLGEVGLNREQVVKVVAGFPPVLACSIEAKLKPTVAWLRDTGLSREQVAKVIGRLPQVFGYSIDAKLKPAVLWLREVGLTQLQVAGVIATFPHVLSLSMQNNLSPKHLFLLEHFTRDELRDIIRRLPALLGYSFARLRHRLQVLQKHDVVSRLTAVMTWTDSRFAERFPS
ncbi:unnamed protein product [Symbiodinium sp. CCMP2456]|nr:unnamed protein product [Symbiodinium sp. CCMP2456]